MPDLTGQLLAGRYGVREFLGRGGMAEVYRVYDNQRMVELALKLLHPDLAQDVVFLRRFRREAQTLASLQHPNIVRFYGIEKDGINAFILMDFIEGTTLRAEISRQEGKPFSPQQILDILKPVCAALHYAHHEGFVHCDVKPANIMINRNGTVLLADFGIARMTESATTTTMVGAGTPAYMAPEQARGELPTPQSDIYALGIVLYEMLTGGERPFTGEQANVTGSTAEKLRWEQLNLAPVSPRRYNPGLPHEVEEVVLRCLEKDPARRYTTAMDLLQAFQAGLGTGAMPVEAPSFRQSPVMTAPQREPDPLPSRPPAVQRQMPIPAQPPQPLPRPVSRNNKPLFIALAGIVVLVLSLGAVSLSLNPRPKSAIIVPVFTPTVLLGITYSPTQIQSSNPTGVSSPVPPATTAPAATYAPTETSEPALTPGAPLPRNETLYFNGQQWGTVTGWNPYSSSNNNAMAIAPGDNARVTMFETPYLFDMIDGKQYPLLADGPWSWNANMTQITFKLKAAAKWSDGTPVTANDVAYTWASNLKYRTSVGFGNADYIDTVTAVDPQTVVIKAKLDANGKAINPLVVAAYLSSNYVIQKAWTQKLEARTGGDPTKFTADSAEDVVYSGPYHKFFTDDTRVVLVRNNSYWGKDASMWGKLPVPKYLAHTIFADNNAGFAALTTGQVDVSQQFNANVQVMWLKDKRPISTYLPDAPYGLGASLPTAFFNLKAYGLDQVAVRKAIAIAVDYDTIIANALTNQSATFKQVPRSLMNPTAGEQALYDHAAVANLQWTGKDIAGAKKLLDAAGITDTNGDGWREFKGKTLHYVATCPNGWSDWQAAIEVVAAAGKTIGIDITTNYPEWSVYQTIVVNWPLPSGYDIFMMWSDGAGPTEPWGRVRHLISGEFAETRNNWNGNWGGYKNPAADALINAIPGETDPARLKVDYTNLVKIYLTEIPSFTLMYRPQSFHTVYEGVWTGFPHQGDGTLPPVPPLDQIDGWSIAGLYNLTLVKN